MAIWNKNGPGAITPALTGSIKNAPGKVRSLIISFNGSTSSFFQLHDKLTATAFSDSTLLGVGFSLTADSNTLILDFEEELTFSTGICWAMSSTQNTYSAIDPESDATSCVLAEYL